MSIATDLRDAFLRGETIIASHWATQHKRSVNKVLEALRDMGSLICAETVQQGRTRCLLWRCVDMDAMQAYGTGKGATDGPTLRLMEAWGIRAADIELPTTTHRMAAEKDKLEAA